VSKAVVVTGVLVLVGRLVHDRGFSGGGLQPFVLST
jgi:hypothetical protein